VPSPLRYNIKIYKLQNSFFLRLLTLIQFEMQQVAKLFAWITIFSLSMAASLVISSFTVGILRFLNISLLGTYVGSPVHTRIDMVWNRSITSILEWLASPQMGQQ
jgi:hypothetical protein